MTITSEELDLERLRLWMQQSLPEPGVTAATALSVTRLPGGYSNLTFDIAIGSGLDAQHVILRRPPVGV